MDEDSGGTLQATERFGATWREDLPAGLVVFLVALPLCLGIALASDAPLMSGVVAGVVGGLVVGTLSGSHLSVSGPAAGLAVIVAEGIHTLGSFPALAAAVVVAGVFQILFGLLRAGAAASLIPHSVIKGMLAAIGIILILKQIPHALGRDADYEGDLSFWVPGGEDNTFSEIVKALFTLSPGVVVVTLVSLAVLIAWERPPIKGSAFTRLLPGPLVAVLLGVVVNQLYGMVWPDWQISAADGHLVQLPVITSASEFQAALPGPAWDRMFDKDVVIVAITIAIVASIESLLSVEAVDKLDPRKRTSPMNRELFAQGVGNAVSGALGGLPVTAVIVRSSANVYAGGVTRLSAIVHGVFLTVLVFAAPTILNLIPLATLAAVLLVVGYKLARISLFQEMYAQGVDQFMPFLVTIIVTIFSDLLLGVAVGFAVGAVMVLVTNHHAAVMLVSDGDTVLLKLTKDVSFLNKPRMRRLLQSIPKGSHVIIDGSRAMFIDHDIRETIEDFCASASHRSITIERHHLHFRPFPIRFPG